MNTELKPVEERDTLDLLELVCQLHSRALNNPRSKNIHNAYVEARQEIERRIKVNNNFILDDVKTMFPNVDDAGLIAVHVASNIRPKLTAQEEAMFIAGFQECVKYISMQGKGNYEEHMKAFKEKLVAETTEMEMCDYELSLGDWVKVEIGGKGHLSGSTLEGKIIAFYPYLPQVKLESGWCFHPSDKILKHVPVVKEISE